MRKIIKKKQTIIILSFLLVLGFFSWRILRRGSQEPVYTTAQVEKGTIVSTISGSGNLVQTNAFTVTTQATGVIKNVFVKDGAEVKKGDKLVKVTLDQNGELAKSKAWASYLSAKNSLEIAKVTKDSLYSDMMSKWEKITDMASGELEGDDNDWLAAQADFRVAEVKYKNQDNVISQNQASLASAWDSYQLVSPIITAPQDGRVSGILVAPGMMLSSADQKLLAIVGERQPLLSVSINEIDIGKIAVEQKVTLTFDALPDKTFTGKVVGIDRTGTQTQGVVNYPVLIQLDTAHKQLYPNMTATAEIIIEAKENVLWVPPQAIKSQAGQTIIKVLINGKPQEKQVEVGLETSSQAEIIKGLSEGEVIIVSEQIPGEQVPAFGGGGGMKGIMPGMPGVRQR